MDSAEQVYGTYARSLDLTVERVHVELEAEWQKIVVKYSDPTDRERALRRVFAELVRVHGAAAAVDARDYVFVRRSEHPVLSKLPMPAAARAARRESVDAAVDAAAQAWPDADQLPQSLLKAATTLVLQPARNTVMLASKAAGTGFVLVPDAGACVKCLMRAGRGVRRRTVGDGGDFHVGCRCLVAETPGEYPESMPVPKLTQVALDMARAVAADTEGSERKRWERARELGAGTLSDWVVFPQLRTAVVPEFTPAAFVDTAGNPLPAPAVHNVFGHVIHGWRSDDPVSDQLQYWRKGHTADAEGPKGKSRFPVHWDDQMIVDAIVAGLEDTGSWQRMGPTSSDPRDRLRKQVAVGDVVLRLQYYGGLDGAGQHLTAFPVKKL